MQFIAYIVEKDQKFWSHKLSKWVASPADGCTYASQEEAQAIADTSGWEAETVTQKIHPKTKKVINFGRDIEASPPGVVREIIIEVKGL